MALSPEQFDVALDDFKTWRKAQDKLKQSMKLASEYFNVPLKNVEAGFKMPDCFHWIDDGVVGGKVKIKIEDTGQEFEINT